MNGVSVGSGSLTPYGPAGDVDGDGKADFFLGSGATSWDGSEFSGLALLVFGADYPEEVSLADAAAFGVRTKRFISTEPHLVAGWSIAQVGDLNGDGYGEVAISAIRAPGSVNGFEHGGRVYVLFGGPWLADAADVQLSEVGKSVGGFVLHGAYGHDQGSGHNNGDFLGNALSAAGDLNGDGLDDLLVTASQVSRGGLQERGAVYVVYGSRTFPKELFISSPETFGVEFLGPSYLDYFGKSVAAVGDIDGDRLQDFVAGAPAPTAAGFYGDAYLIYGAPGTGRARSPWMTRG